jgi:hypothetical protein
MRSRFALVANLSLATGELSACVEAPKAEPMMFAPEYKGIETILLDGDLVNFRVAMKGARSEADVSAYAACAAAQYALIRGFGFARHVRTNVANSGGVWRGDAVYTISAALPRGLKTIDAEVTVRDCGAQGIPTV